MNEREFILGTRTKLPTGSPVDIQSEHGQVPESCACYREDDLATFRKFGCYGSEIISTPTQAMLSGEQVVGGNL